MLFPEERDSENIQALLDALLRDSANTSEARQGRQRARSIYSSIVHAALASKGPLSDGQKPSRFARRSDFVVLGSIGSDSIPMVQGTIVRLSGQLRPERELRSAFGIVRGRAQRIRIRFH